MNIIDKTVSVQFKKWGITILISYTGNTVDITACSDGTAKLDDFFSCRKINRFGAEVGDPIIHDFGDEYFTHKFSVEDHDRIGLNLSKPSEIKSNERYSFHVGVDIVGNVMMVSIPV